MSITYTNLVYLLAAAFFIFGLRGLSHPRNAVRSNMLSATGMLIAVIVTLFDQNIVSFEFILIGIVTGSLIGTIAALRIPITAMPQLVALFNGFGGGASALVAGAALHHALQTVIAPSIQLTVASAASGLIGALTFWGSIVAFGKLQGIITGQPILLWGRHILNVSLFGACLGLGTWLVIDPSTDIAFWLLLGVASLFGISLIIPIGGADMPVVIALLNSYSGLAAAATGFALENNMLIIAGSLVGAAGLILTSLMSRAMNRSLTNVMFAGVGASPVQISGTEEIYTGKVKSATPAEVAMILSDATRVVIVPGYGMAVAQAQYPIRDLVNHLEAEGIETLFAVHPVAGRMPGHMNVLLAEVDIPYDKLKEMDDINPTFQQTDVALIIGANDVVNPAARDLTSSNPIAGMPILNVDHARTVVVVKRSLSPGFAGIPNPLFAADNTLMLFGDAKQMVVSLVSALEDN